MKQRMEKYANTILVLKQDVARIVCHINSRTRAQIKHLVAKARLKAMVFYGVLLKIRLPENKETIASFKSQWALVISKAQTVSSPLFKRALGTKDKISGRLKDAYKKFKPDLPNIHAGIAASICVGFAAIIFALSGAPDAFAPNLRHKEPRFKSEPIVLALATPEELEPASGEPQHIADTQENQSPPPASQAQEGGEDQEPSVYKFEFFDKEQLEVQAVLTSQKSAVIASTLNGKIREIPFKSGEIFYKGDVLVLYDCGFEEAKLRELSARARLSAAQLEASQQLMDMDSLSTIEYVNALEGHRQNEALLEQFSEKLKLCDIVAPFDGRVTNRIASPHEYIQEGRVIMEISSSEHLQAEFLVPSLWLRWLNVGTPLTVYIEESDKNYFAEVNRVDGRVDPVSQSIKITAEIQSYDEQLLPGMSGRAIFKSAAKEQRRRPRGFLGMSLSQIFIDTPPQDNTGPESAEDGFDGDAP